MPRWEGSFIEFKSSHDGKGVFRMVLYKQKRNGEHEQLDAELEIGRSSLHCLYHALKKFAQAERAAVRDLPFTGD